ARQHVVVEREIGGRDASPAGHDHQRADADPERDRPDAHLPGAMAERVVAPRRAMAAFARRALRTRRRRGGREIAFVIAVIAALVVALVVAVMAALVVGVVRQLLRGVLGHPVMVDVVRASVQLAGTVIAVMMKDSVGHQHSRADPEEAGRRLERKLAPVWLTFG